jgi:dTDP-4-dehydrorhamnose 3,5-epimerase
MSTAQTRSNVRDPTRSEYVPFVIVTRRHVDDRGWFGEVFREQWLAEVGITCRFVQDNQSSSSRSATLRGFHFQRPPAAQAKLVSVVRGRVLDVAVDIRRGSPTFGKHASIELSAKTAYQLYIPIGFAHGFISLDDDVLVTYKTSNYYSPVCDAGISWNDPQIAFPWPFREADIIKSDKDGRLPALRDFDSPFPYEGHPLEELPVVKVG